MNLLPILLVVFVATTSLLVATWLFFNRRRLTAAESARERLRQQQEVVPQRRSERSILKNERADASAAMALVLRVSWIAERLELLLVHAGSDVTPPVFLLVSLAFASLGALVTLLVGNPLLFVVAPPFLASVPYFYFARRARKRLNAFQAQLPEAIDMLVSAMRAGYSFQAAMNFIGQEVPDPLGPEFARFYDEQRLGIDVRTALLGIQERVSSMDLKMFVTAVLVQRESGGNLSEVLANISDIMRERFALEGEIDSLTAESKISARILASLPVVVTLGISVMNPSFMRPMWTSAPGQAMLLASGVAVIIGYFLMMKIADIDV